MERLANVKNSSLLRKFVNYGCKKFYNIGHKFASVNTPKTYYWMQGDRKIWKKRPKVGKSSQNSSQAKKSQNIFIKAQLESPEHLHQTPSELLKYLSKNHIGPLKSSPICEFRPIWSPWLIATMLSKKIVQLKSYFIYYFGER